MWDIVHFAVDRSIQLPEQGEEEARAKAEEVQACKVCRSTVLQCAAPPPLPIPTCYLFFIRPRLCYGG